MLFYLYQVGLSLHYQSHTYVRRQADDELYETLIAGEFCHVLSPSQTGKSSLLVQAMHSLRKKEKYKCISINLTDMSRDSAYSWYFGIMSELLRSADLHRSVDLDKWWEERTSLSPSQRLASFIEDVLLAKISQKIVIFVDEVDSLMNLSWKDDFFLLVRSAYNKRATDSAYKRLTFCFAGVAMPADLVDNKESGSFDIGKAIYLAGLDLDRARPILIPGLMAERTQELSEEIFDEIFRWTNGQPFLTQRLCELVKYEPVRNRFDVSSLIQECVISNWQINDRVHHLSNIRDRLLMGRQENAVLMLKMCQKILEADEQKIPADNSIEQKRLELTGFATRSNGYLQVSNPIYAAVFNSDWVQKELNKTTAKFFQVG
jgi:hypothetical protein